MKQLIVFIFLIISQIVLAQSADSITIKTKNYKADSIFISYNYGKKQIVLDTLRRKNDENFLLSSDIAIPSGVYYAGTFSQRKLFPFIITEKDNHFDLFLNFVNKNNYSSTGSKENKIFFDYRLRTAESKRNQNMYLRQRQMQKKDSVILELNNLRRKYVEQNPGTLAAIVIKSETEWMDPDITDAKGIDKRNKILNYKIKNYLKNIDLNNPASMRLPNTHKTIVDYFDRVVHLKPEAVIPSLDSILQAMGYNSEMYKYYLPFFERKYSFAFQPWVDKVYIHIANKYYNKDISPWLSEKEIERVQYEAQRKEGSLPGKVIPDVTLVDKNDKSIRLRDIDAKYMILIFWRPGCSHCRHAMPLIRDFQKKYKKEGVKIVTACTRQRSDTYRCWDGVKSEKMEGFDYNLADKSGKTNFLRKYNIGGVPNIFIIDKNKKIIDKKVAPTLLADKFEKILKEGK